MFFKSVKTDPSQADEQLWKLQWCFITAHRERPTIFYVNHISSNQNVPWGQKSAFTQSGLTFWPFGFRSLLIHCSNLCENFWCRTHAKELHARKIIQSAKSQLASSCSSFCSLRSQNFVESSLFPVITYMWTRKNVFHIILAFLYFMSKIPKLKVVFICI